MATEAPLRHVLMQLCKCPAYFSIVMPERALEHAQLFDPMSADKCDGKSIGFVDMLRIWPRVAHEGDTFDRFLALALRPSEHRKYFEAEYSQ